MPSVVTDPTVRGVVAANRIAGMRDELDINIKNAYLIVNRVAGALTPALQAAVDEVGIPLAGIIPADPQVTNMDANGQALVNLPPDSVIVQAIESIVRQTVPAQQPS